MINNTNPNLPIYFIGQDNNSCRLESSIKKEYYKHNYNPSKVYENLKRYYEEKELKEIFNLKNKSECCKCIAISLYYKKSDYINNTFLYNYLISILKTTINVRKNLPEWIVRLYIDESVKEYLAIYESINTEIYEEIKNMPNTEIYTYKCDKIYIDGKLRTFRFIPFIDESVSTHIIREADGVVTNMDCRNIEIFSNSDKLFYLPDLGNSEINTDLRISSVQSHYQKWLIKMKAYMISEPNKFKNEILQYRYQDLLAGLFSSNLKINLDYLERKVKLANEIIMADVDITNNNGNRI